MMSDIALSAEIREKRFGDRVVLRDVRLALRAGELVALVGASGCGKSTLLRVVAGLDDAYAGEVRLDGARREGPTRDTGVVFQEPRLFPWLSVLDNVAFAAERGQRDEARARALIDEVGLAAHAQALPRQLSGGQAQRAALARALYTRPRALLLDEPFSALDASTRGRLQGLLGALVRHHRLAALLVTHDVDEAVALADRVVVLDASPGRVRDEFAPAATDREAARERILHVLHGHPAAATS